MIQDAQRSSTRTRLLWNLSRKVTEEIQRGDGSVVAVSAAAKHGFSKARRPTIVLVAGFVLKETRITDCL